MISDTTPEHSRKFTVTTKSETFRSPNFIRASPHINTIVTFESTTTCVSSLNITLFQSLFKVHLSFDLHQCTRRCLFSVRMARVLRIFLLVNSWNRNRLRTVLVEIVFGKTLWIHFVRNFRQTVSSVRFHTTQNLSVTAVISFSWSTTSSFIFTTFTLIESLQKFWHTWLTYSKYFCNSALVYSILEQIRVIIKLPNSEQSYKGKVKTHNYINRQNQSTTGKLWKP